jgi:hypothetical protein
MQRLRAVLAVALSACATAFAADIQNVTDPEGAEVSQGTMHLGATTKEGLRIVGVERGTATFTISKPGFKTVTKVVSVESATAPLTLLVRLQTDATPGATEANPTTPKPEASPPASGKKSSATKTTLLVVGAGAVGAAVLAASGSSSSLAAATTTTTPLPPAASLADLSATVTSPQEGGRLNCNENAYFTVSLTNTARALVFVRGVRLHTTSVVGNCTGAPDFTYNVTNSQLGTGTADVLNNQVLFSNGVGCCERPPCGGDACNFRFSFTVLTSVGDVPAGTIDFAILFNGCPTCSSFAGLSAARCPAKR